MASQWRAAGILLTLVVLFLSLLPTTLAAPIGVAPPIQESVLAKRSPVYYAQLHHSRSIDRRALEADAATNLLQRSFDESAILETRSFDGIDENEMLMVKRDVSASATGTIQNLERRRSIFNKIKDAFKKAGKAIKKGFQKVGAGIKKVAQKMGNGIKTAAKKVASGVKHAVNKVKQGFKKAGSAIKKGFKKVGSKIKQGFKKAGKAIKHGFQKVKKGFQKAGKAIKKGLQKAGKWIKKNGAKIAKFGLKILATAASIGSKIAKFIPIPGVRDIASKVLSAESKVADFAANKIHADLGSKLGKGFKILDKIEHPVSGAAGAILDNFKRDEEGARLFARDLFTPHPEELFARDLPASDLEARSFEELGARSFGDLEELEARSFDDFELEARSLFGEDDY